MKSVMVIYNTIHREQLGTIFVSNTTYKLIRLKHGFVFEAEEGDVVSEFHAVLSLAGCQYASRETNNPRSVLSDYFLGLAERQEAITTRGLHKKIVQLIIQ